MSQFSQARRALTLRAQVGVLALAITAALALSSCQGAGSPIPSSTAAASPSASSSPTPSATSSAAYKPATAKGKAQNVPVPVMPALAKENSEKGLEAFVKYWYATYSYAGESGDLSLWTDITDMTSTVAVAHKRAVELNYVSGRWVVGGRISTPRIEVKWDEGASSQSATVQVIQERIQYFDADGSVGQPATPASNNAEAVIARFANGSWRVTDNGKIVG